MPSSSVANRAMSPKETRDVQVHPHVHPAHELVVVGPARGGELEPPKEFRFRVSR